MDETPSTIDIQASAREAQASSPEKIAAEDANRAEVNLRVADARRQGGAELLASQGTAEDDFGWVFPPTHSSAQVASLGWKRDSWGDTRKG